MIARFVTPWAAIGIYLLSGLIKEYIVDRYIGLEEGIENFRHYLGNTGTDKHVSYEKAVAEDDGIKKEYDLEVRNAYDAARALRADDSETEFQFYRETTRAVTSTSTNWIRTLGRI